MSKDVKIITIGEKIMPRPLDAPTLAHMQLEPPAFILAPWLAIGELTMIHGPSGCGKTLLAAAIAAAVSSGGTFCGWQSPVPQDVVLFDGEMRLYSLKNRYMSAYDSLQTEPSKMLRMFSKDFLQDNMPRIATKEGQKDIQPYLDGTRLVILDNISTLFSAAEHSVSAWQPVQDWLIQLRQRGTAVLLIHHDNKTGAQRGHNKKIDILDTIIALRRPENYVSSDGVRIEVHFDKCRHFYGDAAKPFEARLTSNLDGADEWLRRDL